ncbi:MAG: S-layer homology domain-containing protein [Niameybacter sp.]|uniref:S-layer homology domain-containing protein n=1 Tax=Niameybacter sp. TaxID=2033640 RepID=UPI002FCA4D46
MRLNLRLKKALAMLAVSTVVATTIPATLFAADYDTHWAKEMIEKWSEKEVLKGYEDGTFRPNATVTRGELAAMLVRVFGLTDTSSAAKYTDVETTKWYAADVAKVSSAGIMNDYADGTFKPEEKATREEAAYAMAKAYQVATKDATNNFTDAAQISDWAEDEIAALVAGGYLDGNPDGSFRPQATLTRAEAVTMVHKITADLVNVAGVYSQDIKGNLVVNAAGVELSDMTITGNLYLAEGIGEGEVKLNNVTVLGDIIVEGGGNNTINIMGQSKVNNIIVDKAGKLPVKVIFGNLIEVKGAVTLKSAATLEGHTITLANVALDGAKEVQLVGNMKIDNIVINQTAELALVDGVTVQTATINEKAADTILRGRGAKGAIKNIKVNAEGVKIQKGFTYNKDNVTVADTVTTKPTFPEAGGGGGGGGGSTSGGGTTQAVTELTKVEVKLAGQETPVTIDLTGKKTINVVVSGNAIQVNGQTVATTADTIESITAFEKGGKVTVTASIAGLGVTAIDLISGEAYDLAKLKVEAASKYEQVMTKVLPLVKPAFTNGRYEKIEAKVKEEYNDFIASTATNVPVSKVLAKLSNAKVQLEKLSPEARQELQDAAVALNATVTGLDTLATITVEVPLTVKAGEAVTGDYTLKVTY